MADRDIELFLIIGKVGAALIILVSLLIVVSYHDKQRVENDSGYNSTTYPRDVVKAFCIGEGYENGFDSLVMDKITCYEEVGENSTLMVDYSREELRGFSK